MDAEPVVVGNRIERYLAAKSLRQPVAHIAPQSVVEFGPPRTVDKIQVDGGKSDGLAGFKMECG
jgi:hypothetical protein